MWQGRERLCLSHPISILSPRFLHLQSFPLCLIPILLPLLFPPFLHPLPLHTPLSLTFSSPTLPPLPLSPHTLPSIYLPLSSFPLRSYTLAPSSHASVLSHDLFPSSNFHSSPPITCPPTPSTSALPIRFSPSAHLHRGTIRGKHRFRGQKTERQDDSENKLSPPQKGGTPTISS